MQGTGRRDWSHPQSNHHQVAKEWQSLEDFLQSIILCMCEQESIRGATLLALLLASHNLSIEDSYQIFLGVPSETEISVQRFNDIFHRLVPIFSITGPRIESLFFALTNFDAPTTGIGQT